MDAVLLDYLKPPDDRHELLELLHNIVRDFADHFQRRSCNQADPQLVRLKFMGLLYELYLYLDQYIKQGVPVDDELYTAAKQVAERLKSTLHGSRIQEVLRHEKLEAKIAKAEDCISGFPELEDFKTLILDVPKSRQTYCNREIVKKMPDDVCTMLAEPFSDLVIVLWRQNPNNKITAQAAKLFQPPKMRYSEKSFTTEMSWFHDHEQLYGLLRQYWPCTCQRNHQDKLGDCERIMLRLRSSWTHPGLPTGEFDVKLDHGQANINCNICIQSEKTPALEKEKKFPQPCQMLMKGIQGMKLKIIATNFTANAAGDVEFIPFERDQSKSVRCITLQNVIDQGLRFRLRDRRSLAVILVYSFMQLLRGSWLEKPWGGADIYFNSESPSYVDLRRPYLSAYWMASHDKRSQQVKLPDGYHPMPDMVTLARYLLELELRDTCCSPIITENGHSDLFTANEFLDRIQSQDDSWENALFIESMTACLAPETYTRDADANPPHSLWWEIYQKVVNPLEQILLSIHGPNATAKDIATELTRTASLIREIPAPGPKSTNANPAAERFTESDKWFQRLNDYTHAFLDSVRTKFGKAIHVAILDTGVDLNDTFLKERISACDCWDFVEDNERIRDKVGHGTHTASILAKTAPRARIFCGRVWKERREDENTGRLIAKAIEHAVNEWKAQIIVMPFAFPHTIEEIDDAIDEHHSRALLFAATSNKNDEETGFPARHADVIGVYSNRTPSVQSEFCKPGKEHERNFSAIGEDVNGSWPQGLEGEDASRTGRERRSGTSCSTPIAAGVAALVLEFASLEGRVEVSRPAKLKKKKVMEKVLFDCMTDKHTSGTYNLLQPWKLFSPYNGRNSKPKTLQSVADTVSTSIMESNG